MELLFSPIYSIKITLKLVFINRTTWVGNFIKKSEHPSGLLFLPGIIGFLFPFQIIWESVEPCTEQLPLGNKTC